MSWTLTLNGVPVERGDDSTRVVTTYDGVGGVTHSRPYTAAENAAADAAAADAATLSDLVARMERIEAKLWPAPGTPTEPGDAPTFDGVWSNQGLILEDGTVWRNVSGVPLTEPPSRFPGNPSQWPHLFVIELAPEPEPHVPDWEQPSGAGGYDEGGRVVFEGHIWRSTFAGKNIWSPTAYPAAWVDEGPA